MSKTKHMRITPRIAKLKKQYDNISRQVEGIIVVSEYDRLFYGLLDEKRRIIRDRMNALIGSDYYDFKKKIIVIY